VATVLGWKCVVPKGQFTVGDSGVYISLDVIVPDKPEFDFMKERHFRVRTVRLRKQISQGLFMPLSILPSDISAVYEGMDVTEILGIAKYEKEMPAELKGHVKGRRPDFIPKTDEERIQSCLRVLHEIKDLIAILPEH
jgi:RNA ligase (TIGR02306 family)